MIHTALSSKTCQFAITQFFLKTRNGNRNVFQSIHKCFSSGNNYSVSEVKINVPGGTIAGKLWEPHQRTLQLQKRDPSTSVPPLPPIICVHGWLDNAGSFDTLLPLLINRNNSPTVFAFDLPGHGLTTYCPQWFYDAQVEGIISIKRVLNHFGWQKVSYIGHSLGGIIGFIFAAFFPDHVHKFVALENMRPLPHPLIDVLRSSLNLVFEVEERDKVPRKSYPPEELVEKFCQGRQNTISLEGCRLLLKRGAIPVQNDRFQYSYNFRTLIPGQEGRFSEERSKELATLIKSPTCFIKGDDGNVYETEEDSIKFFATLQNSLGPNNFQTHRCPGTHHFHLDNPQPVADIIKPFLGL